MRRPFPVAEDDVVTEPTTATTARQVTKLIELGRDREAALLATSRGDTMDPRSQLEQVGPLLAGVVGGITPDQLDNPTPCDGFTVRGVLVHMIGGATAFTAAFRGTEPTTPDTSDVLAAFGPALQDLAAAISAPGALDRTIAAPFGETPGAAFASFVVLDGLVHGWDLAVATDQAYEPPDALVADVDAFAHQALDQLRDGETFREAVVPPASASPIERLAAYTGRRVPEVTR
jgi:uncharacterized protein (TIGR03086 family)